MKTTFRRRGSILGPSSMNIPFLINEQYIQLKTVRRSLVLGHERERPLTASLNQIRYTVHIFLFIAGGTIPGYKSPD